MEHNTKQISEWLRSIGLEELLPKFEREAISLFGLVEMKKDDLKDIGVHKLGHLTRIIANAEDLKLTLGRTIDSMPAEVKQISDVLNYIGLSQYVSRFEEEVIGIPAFCDINDEDLIDLNISKKGQRILILAAARNLKSRIRSLDYDCSNIEHILDETGLSHLTAQFENEMITPKVLTMMRRKDFEDIGIKKMGPRLLLMAAAKRLTQEPDSTLQTPQTIDGILDDLGLQILGEVLKNEAISMKSLIRMGGDDLKEIGVHRKGHRILLMRTIEKIKQDLGEENLLPVIPENTSKFLEMIGLQDLNKTFQHNEFTLRILPYITEDDLIDQLGILKKGERILILTAAKQLEANFSTAGFKTQDDIGTIEKLLTSYGLQHLIKEFQKEDITKDDLMRMDKNDLKDFVKPVDLVILMYAINSIQKSTLGASKPDGNVLPEKITKNQDKSSDDNIDPILRKKVNTTVVCDMSIHAQ